MGFFTRKEFTDLFLNGFWVSGLSQKKNWSMVTSGKPVSNIK